MLSEAKKYHDYARECVRLAGRAETPELRDKLIDLARVWMDAALTEEEAQEKDDSAFVSHTALTIWDTFQSSPCPGQQTHPSTQR